MKNLEFIFENRVYVMFYFIGVVMGIVEDLGKFFVVLMFVDDNSVLFVKRDMLDEMLLISLYYDGILILWFVYGFVEMEYWVFILFYEGNLKGFLSKVVFDLVFKFGMVVMINIVFEEVYYYGFISKIFGNSIYVNLVVFEGGGYF